MHYIQGHICVQLGVSLKVVAMTNAGSSLLRTSEQLRICFLERKGAERKFHVATDSEATEKND